MWFLHWSWKGATNSTSEIKCWAEARVGGRLIAVCHGLWLLQLRWLTVILVSQWSCSLELDPTAFDPLSPSMLPLRADMIISVTAGGSHDVQTQSFLIKTRCSLDLRHQWSFDIKQPYTEHESRTRWVVLSNPVYVTSFRMESLSVLCTFFVCHVQWKKQRCVWAINVRHKMLLKRIIVVKM